MGNQSVRTSCENNNQPSVCRQKKFISTCEEPRLSDEVSSVQCKQIELDSHPCRSCSQPVSHESAVTKIAVDTATQVQHSLSRAQFSPHRAQCTSRQTKSTSRAVSGTEMGMMPIKDFNRRSLTKLQS